MSCISCLYAYLGLGVYNIQKRCSGVAVQDGKAQMVFIFHLQIFLSLSLSTSLYPSPFLSLIQISFLGRGLLIFKVPFVVSFNRCRLIYNISRVSRWDNVDRVSQVLAQGEPFNAGSKCRCPSARFRLLATTKPYKLNI
jgi:hypothetical protein